MTVQCCFRQMRYALFTTTSSSTVLFTFVFYMIFFILLDSNIAGLCTFHDSNIAGLYLFPYPNIKDIFSVQKYLIDYCIGS